MSVGGMYRATHFNSHFGGSNGGYWSAGQAIYGGPTTQSNTVHWGAGQQALAQQFAQAQTQALLAQQAAVIGTGQAPFGLQYIGAEEFYAEPEPIKDAGIKVGEILGWRVWPIRHGWLYSITADCEWVPGEIIKAHDIGVDLGSGIHAFKRRIDAIRYTSHETCAIGQVALWGEIYEFDRGWHGEYATVHSIDFIRSPYTPTWLTRMSHRRLLKELRMRYCPQPNPSHTSVHGE